MRNNLLIKGIIGFIVIMVVLLAISLFNLLNNQNVNNLIVNAKSLPIPILLEPFKSEESSLDFMINVQSGSTNFIGDLQTSTLGYNGDYLGPVIKVTKGQEIRMHVKNDLKVETSVHWHGLEVEGTEDGGPHQVISAGSLWEPVFTINQPASTLWFHPHVIGTTDRKSVV